MGFKFVVAHLQKYWVQFSLERIQHSWTMCGEDWKWTWSVRSTCQKAQQVFTGWAISWPNFMLGLDTNHSIRRLRKGENAYTTAIRTVAEILQDYDYDKKVLGLTFGANRCKQTNKQTKARKRWNSLKSPLKPMSNILFFFGPTYKIILIRH